MNNISNIDLDCNFNNLRNMIQFNCGKMYSFYKEFHVDKGTDSVDGILKDDKNWQVHMVTDKLDSIMEVSISEAELIFDIATTHIPSEEPFVTDYVKYKRYECVSTETVPDSAIRNDTKKTYDIKSDIYTLGYSKLNLFVCGTQQCINVWIWSEVHVLKHDRTNHWCGDRLWKSFKAHASLH